MFVRAFAPICLLAALAATPLRPMDTPPASNLPAVQSGPAADPGDGLPGQDLLEGLLRLPITLSKPGNDLHVHAEGHVWLTETHALLRTGDRLSLHTASGKDQPLGSNLEPAYRALAGMPGRLGDLKEMHDLVVERLGLAEDLAVLGLPVPGALAALRSALADLGALKDFLVPAADAPAPPAAAAAAPASAQSPGIFEGILATIDLKDSPSPIRAPRQGAQGISPASVSPVIPASRAGEPSPAAVPAASARAAASGATTVAASSAKARQAKNAGAPAASSPSAAAGSGRPSAGGAASSPAAGQGQAAGIHTCSYCGKTGFKKAWYLTRHERVHTLEKPFACRKCGQRFSTGPNRNRHEKHQHGLKALKRHACAICSKVLTSEGYLARHRRECHPAGEVD